jgi:hypothetical protein
LDEYVALCINNLSNISWAAEFIGIIINPNQSLKYSQALAAKHFDYF